MAKKKTKSAKRKGPKVKALPKIRFNLTGVTKKGQQIMGYQRQLVELKKERQAMYPVTTIETVSIRKDSKAPGGVSIKTGYQTSDDEVKRDLIKKKQEELQQAISKAKGERRREMENQLRQFSSKTVDRVSQLASRWAAKRVVSRKLLKKSNARVVIKNQMAAPYVPIYIKEDTMDTDRRQFYFK